MTSFEKLLEKEGLDTVGFSPLMSFVNGNVTRLKNGNLKVVIEIPGDAILESCKGVPMNDKQWENKPMLVFVK